MATAVTYIATSAATLTGDSIAVPLMQDVLATSAPGAVLGVFLARWCAASPKPIMLLLDEVDALVSDTLIALLRQLRAGYPTRPGAFPQSLILCGVRNLKDYRIQASSERASSPAAARSTSRPNHCDWGTSSARKWTTC